MKAWLGLQSAKIAAVVLGKLAPGIIAQLLARINPDTVAVKVRPHMEAVMESLPSELRSLYVAALRKLVDIAAACIPAGGGKR